MKFEEYESEWARDCSIDKLHLDSESVKIPSLHAKWWKHLNAEKKTLRELSERYRAMENVLEGFYSRTLSVEEMTKYGFSELPDKKVLKPEMAKTIACHPKMVELKIRIGLQQDKVDYLQDIIKAIHTRSFAIRDAIEFIKYQNGG